MSFAGRTGPPGRDVVSLAPTGPKAAAAPKREPKAAAAKAVKAEPAAAASKAAVVLKVEPKEEPIDDDDDCDVE